MPRSRLPRPVTARPATPHAGLARRDVLAAAVAGLGIVGTGNALWAQEGGEAGEGSALAELPETVAFLTELGLYESQIMVVAALSAAGRPDLAREHLETTHHADYADLAERVSKAGGADFAAEAGAFGAAVTAGSADQVATTAAAVMAPIAALRAKAGDRDRMLAAEALLRHSAEDLEAGVTDGKVELAQEYRDSWGFTMVALEWLEELAADKTPEVAAAAQAGLSGKDDVLAQYAGLDAAEAPADAGALLAAAARVELAAYRLK